MYSNPVFTIYIYRDGPRKASNTLYRCIKVKVDGEVIRDVPPEVRDLDFVGTVETQDSNKLENMISIHTGEQDALIKKLEQAGFTVKKSEAEKLAST